ncbi:DUF3429 domain-containing protein [Novosphingobium sp.]|uniref:DUF3429 domain-containing protein n=1 Tax=Novosphingobium sp. TaxID=1874826 RepID=UPI00273772C9|nr:DUF3429 domain-containing protein [Novosphingobium sp.]MDP3907190.1 DUF3429 domain-containing protein [Novosphingobium sp.]
MALPQSLRQLGYAGLLPQAAAVVVALDGGEWRWTALAVGFGYAALIFSFLGGVWWGIGVARDDAPSWIFAVAVVPSLIALAAYLPWIAGYNWPGPSLLVVGACLLLTPLVDRAIGFLPAGWLALRLQLSLGLGAMSLALGVLAL